MLLGTLACVSMGAGPLLRRVDPPIRPEQLLTDDKTDFDVIRPVPTRPLRGVSNRGSVEVPGGTLCQLGRDTPKLRSLRQQQLQQNRVPAQYTLGKSGRFCDMCEQRGAGGQTSLLYSCQLGPIKGWRTWQF